MRLLFVTPFLPDCRAAHGGGVYLGALMNALRPVASIGVCALVEPGAPPAANPPGFAWLATVPHDSHGGGLGARLRRLWHWRHLPLVAAKAWNPGMVHALARALAEFQPDVAFVEMAQMAQYLPHLDRVPTILTDHEAGCPANTRTGLGALGDRRDRALWARFVRTHFAAATCVQALTEEDAGALRLALGREVLVRPPTIELPLRAVEPAQAPPRALFLGDYRHAPNPEAAHRLVHEVLPRLRTQVPNAELWLAGPNEAPIRALAQHAGVRVLGFVPDLAQLFGDVRLLLAPLWSGGGFRVKAATALAHGLPVVTNALGSRGCSAPSPAMQVADSNAGLVELTAELLQSPAGAGVAGQLAFEWAQEHLSAEAVATQQLQRAAALRRR